jgi:hypothetical protein
LGLKTVVRIRCGRKIEMKTWVTIKRGEANQLKKSIKISNSVFN